MQSWRITRQLVVIQWTKFDSTRDMARLVAICQHGCVPLLTLPLISPSSEGYALWQKNQEKSVSYRAMLRQLLDLVADR
jgi:hypothetical protein